MRAIDLSQPLGPATPPWADRPAMTVEGIPSAADAGLYARRLCFDEHYGTHVDAIRHALPDGRTIDEIPAGELVLDTVLLDVADDAGDDATFVATAEHLNRFEDRYGRLAPGVLVLIRFGWDRLLGTDPVRYAGSFPGCAPDLAEALVERQVAGWGVDTLSVDPSHAAALPCHRISAPAGLLQIEGLVGLEQLPVEGATTVVGVLPVVGGSGAPARVIALVPGR